MCVGWAGAVYPRRAGSSGGLLGDPILVFVLESPCASLGDLKLQIRIPVPCVTLGLSPDPSEPQSPPLKQDQNTSWAVRRSQ